MSFSWIREASYVCVTLNKKYAIFRTVGRRHLLPVGISSCLREREYISKCHRNFSTQTFHPNPHFSVFWTFYDFIACSAVQFELNVVQSPLVASIRSERTLPPTRKVADFHRSAEQRVYPDNTVTGQVALVPAGADLPIDHVVPTRFNSSEPSGLTFNKSTFCPHSVFMCFVWISEQTAIISLYNINWLVFITQIVFTARYGLDL
jgi:hypothetical protein